MGSPAMTVLALQYRGDAVDLDVEMSGHAGSLTKIRAGGFLGK
jgi:hypothetical protein